jgi:hypothetical protein
VGRFPYEYGCGVDSFFVNLEEKKDVGAAVEEDVWLDVVLLVVVCPTAAVEGSGTDVLAGFDVATLFRHSGVGLLLL